MAQSRFFDFGQNLTSDTFAELTRDLLVPGVYSGFNAETVPATGGDPSAVVAGEVQLTPGTVLLDDGVLVVETEVQTFNFDTATFPQRFVIVVTHMAVNIVGGQPAVFSIIPVQNLPLFVVGLSYYVLATVDIIDVTGLNHGSISNAQKIKDRLSQLLQQAGVSSVTESLPVPFSGGGSDSCSSALSEVLQNASGAPVNQGHVVRITGNSQFGLAQANSANGVNGLVGVVQDPNISINAVGFVGTHGKESVTFEAGLTLVPGDKVYVSATSPGLATNVPPGDPNVLATIGIIKDTTTYNGSAGDLAIVDLQLGGSGTSSETLSLTYQFGANQPDQTMVLTDANGGGVTVNAASGAFTDAITKHTIRSVAPGTGNDWWIRRTNGYMAAGLPPAANPSSRVHAGDTTNVNGEFLVVETLQARIATPATQGFGPALAFEASGLNPTNIATLGVVGGFWDNDPDDITGDIQAGVIIASNCDGVVPGKYTGAKLIYTISTQTTTAAPAILIEFSVPNNTSWHLLAHINAISSGFQSAQYSVAFGAHRFDTNGGLVVTGEPSAPTVLISYEDDPTWDATFDIAGDNIRLVVTGVNATSIKWAAVVEALAMAM